VTFTSAAISLPTPRPESDGADEAVDLPIPLPVDDAPGLSLGRTSGRPGEAAATVAVLNRIDVPEVACDPVEL
jgi:hypothetical protein